MTVTRALVHLGPVKTGTTALSRYFTLTNRSGTTPKSIVFPTGDLWFGEDGNIVRQRYEMEGLMSKAHRPPGNESDASLPGSDVDIALAKVSDALRATKLNSATAVFVVETGLPRFDPRHLNAVMRRHFDVVDYLFIARRQDKLVSSIIAQHMKMREKRWATLSPRWEMLKVPRLRDFAALDYAAQYRRWVDGVGADHVFVVWHDEDDHGSFGTIDRIFEFANLGVAPRVEGIEGLRIHPTFSTLGMKKMAWLKSITRVAWLWPPFRPRLTEAWTSRLFTYHNQAIDGLPDDDGTPFEPWTLSASDRRWVMRRFLTSNRTLRSMQSSHGASWDEWIRQVEENSR
jgi:hypothetical protein